MTELLGVLSETSQDARFNNAPVVLTFRAWNPRVESWDDYVGVLERAFALYLDGYHRTMMTEQPGYHPDPAALERDSVGP
jgi:hypothetical protein